MTNPAGAAVAAPSTTARPSAAHHVLIAVLFLVAIAGTCGLLHSRLPFPSVPDIASRFRYFAEHKDEFDTIFIGSSHIRHGLIPQEFDEQAAKHGLSTHSFNLGYSGMWPPESCYYLRQVLALRPKKLRWVFIELMDFRGQAEGETTNARSVYWHDVLHTNMAWRLAMESPLSGVEKVELLVHHTWEFIQNMSNPGRGAEWVEERYFPVKKKSDRSWIPRRGFDPEPDSGWPLEGRLQYRRQIVVFQRVREQNQMRPGLADALRSLAAEVERAGAKPIFVVLPTVRSEEHFDAASAPGLGTVLAFDDPARFPRLYEPEQHYDPGHLNEAGAREFSGLLGEQFVNAVHTGL